MSTSWTRALVTGASSGIGDAFARELAADGVDLVVVARSGDALETLAAQLRADHGIDVEVLTADLTDDADLAKVADRLRDRWAPVDLLVNNAGFGASGRFHELDAELQDRMVRLNLIAPTVLSHAAIPVLRERGGAILNVASMVALLPVPHSAVYAATKAYVLSFSEALHEELKRSGVTVTCLNPGYTRTKFQETGDYETSQVPKAMWMGARAVARSGLNAAGNGRAVATPGPNAPVAAMMRLAPSAVLRKGAGAFATGTRPPIPTRHSPATRERALITGASRGLGEEFARQLAAGGTDLVLTARTEDDLNRLATQLRDEHGVSVEILVADLATSEGVELVASRLRVDDLPAIDLFVNNAGIGSTGAFAKADLAAHVRLLDVNVRAATALAHAATRSMVARGTGAVINVSSLASFQSLPNNSVYAAGKAYLRWLSEAVHEEQQSTGVRHLALCPGLTRTNIFEASGGDIEKVPSLMLAEPPTVVSTALRRLDQPGATTVPVWYNRALATATSHLPRSAVRVAMKKFAR